MRLPRRLLFAAILATGALLLLLGWRVQPRAYLSALLLNLGVAVLLVLPLLWIEQLVERRVRMGEAQTRRQFGTVAERVERVERDVRETRRSVASLDALMEAQLAEVSRSDAARVWQAREDVSVANVAAAFARADELRAISTHGLRVALPGRWDRLRFRLAADGDAPALELRVEAVDGEDLGLHAIWSGDADATEPLFALAEAWKRRGAYPGDGAFDARAIFDELLRSLEVAIHDRHAGGDDQLDPLIEMLSQRWALTDYGLEHVGRWYYVIERGELADERRLAEQRAHMREKTWVMQEDAEPGADDFWTISLVAHRFFAAHPAPPRA